MNSSVDAITCVEKVFARCLTDAEECCLRGSWDDLTYQQIADRSCYSTDYMKQVGAALWKDLSALAGQEVNKGNFKSAIRKLCNE